MRILSKALMAMLLLTMSSITFAASGPLILGGDDLDDHGSRDGAGVNLTGWSYLETAVASLIAGSSNPGTTVDVVVIGPTDPGAGNFPSGNSGGAANSVVTNLGLTILYLDGQAAIAQFFTDLGTSTVVPKVIWIVSDGATNDLDTADETELALHGPALSAFQLSGGGILSESHDYDWLSSLLPGVSIDNSCSTPVALTAAGNTDFPSLTNTQVNAACHNTFSGNIGGLAILATDNNDLSVIIGGSAGITFGPTNIPTLSFWGLMLMTLLLGIMGKTILRRR